MIKFERLSTNLSPLKTFFILVHPHIDASNSSVPPISNGTRLYREDQINDKSILATFDVPLHEEDFLSRVFRYDRSLSMQHDFRLESDKALLKPRNPRTIGTRGDTIAKQWTKFVWMQKETKLKKVKNEVRFRVKMKRRKW